MESRFPMEIKKCPSCGSSETVTGLAWQEEADKGKVDRDTPVAAEHLQVPLLDPSKSVGISSGILIIHIDYCANCGTRYCTRVEVVTGQVHVGSPPGGGMKGFPRRPNLHLGS